MRNHPLEDEANQLQNAVPQGSQGTQAAKQRLGELLPSLRLGSSIHVEGRWGYQKTGERLA